MAKNKKNKLIDVNGNEVSSEAPNLIDAINESTVAQDTVSSMQALLTRLSELSTQNAVGTVELFAKLSDLGVDLPTTVKLYAALKQAYLTTVYVVEGDHTRADMVTNLFSLVLGNAIFFRQFTEIAEENLAEVIIIVTNIMFQIEAGNDDGEQAS